MTWRSRRAEPDIPGLADQCEAFLAGRVAEQASASNRPVPPWAWINLVAHASEAELQRLANDGEPLPQGPVDGRWWVAVDRIALAVLTESSKSGKPVEQLQRDVLGRIESFLIDLPADATPSPSWVAAIALAALYGHPCLPY